MSSKRLDFDFDSEAFTIAISCHQKSYKLAWELNQIFSCEFEIQSEYEEGAVPFISSIEGHTYYLWTHHSERFALHLINNQGEETRIIPQMPQIDYLLIITGLYEELDIENGLKKIKNIESVLTAFAIENPSTKLKK